MTELPLLYDPAAFKRAEREMDERLSTLPGSPRQQLVEQNAQELKEAQIKRLAQLQKLAAEGLTNVLKHKRGSATHEGVDITRELIVEDHGVDLLPRV